MKRLWRGYNLGIVLFALFALSWTMQTWTGWREFAAEQGSHGQAAALFGPDGYVWVWARTTFENWESEFLQLFAMVVLTTYLVFNGSTESKDGQERMQQSLDRIERRLKNVEQAQEPKERTVYGRLLAD